MMPVRSLASVLAPVLALLLATPAVAQTAVPTPPAPVTPAPAAAPTTHDADPALWVVRDHDTTIYLFGTIHVLQPGLSWFDEGVRQAFDRSDTLVLEMVQPPAPEMQALVMRLGMNPTGPILREQMSPAQRSRYEAALTGLNIPPVALDRARPWVAAVQLTLLPLMRLGYDPAQGPESVLTAAAAQEHKPVVGLETAEQQLGYFGQLAPATQLRFLDTTVRDLPNAEHDIGEMVHEWSAGDAAALARTMNEGVADTPELAQVLLYQRNQRWAEWIRQRLATPGTVFIAVGAGHLAGDRSVQADLAHMGLHATRVAY